MPDTTRDIPKEAVTALGGIEPPEGFATPGRAIYLAVATLSGALCAYHGARRNDSILWAAWWATAGALVPFFAVPVALAQGLGTPRKDLNSGDVPKDIHALAAVTRALTAQPSAAAPAVP